VGSPEPRIRQWGRGAAQKSGRRGESHGTRVFTARMSGSTSIYTLLGQHMGGNNLPGGVSQKVILHGGEVRW